MINNNSNVKNSSLWVKPIVYLVDGRQVFITDNYPNLNYTIIKVDTNKILKIKDFKKPKYSLKNNKSKKSSLKHDTITSQSKNNNKKVTFNNIVNINNTYSNEEYDRSPIDSIIYLRTLQRVNLDEWKNIFTELNQYKLQEMIVHKDSINNVKIHNF